MIQRNKTMCFLDDAMKKMQEMNITKKFHVLFDELGHCSEIEQEQKIEEMRRMVEKMNEDEFQSVITTKMFNGINKMVEEKKLITKNLILLLKCIGCRKILINISSQSFDHSFLCKRIVKMIVEEDDKKEEKNEKLIVDLCECYFVLNAKASPEKFFSTCIPYLFKVASNKEENEKTQKEVEIVLLSLSQIYMCYDLEKELYLNEIKDIILYHQEHHNLTRIAYQSAWHFLISRIFFNGSLEDVIVNKLHFIEDTTKELEELSKYIVWKREKEEERGKEAKELLILMMWLETIRSYFFSCKIWNEKYVGLISSIVQVLRATKDNYRKYFNMCLCLLRKAAENEAVKVEDLLKGGAVDVVLEEIRRSKMDDEIAYYCLVFFLNIAERRKEEEENKMEEMKRKAMKMEIFEKMEEGGCEDTITSFHKKLYFLYRKYYGGLSLNICDYFVKV
ncbi:uncharacterized protein MONOS_18577 [Monocercomonoides exilis]|uniref:uncharacterized protein n=1 Tax=Monocercomonoides exilis TaxID=2049356 RepID=UPI00355A776A|nr:hypothetical protein MONOS_18577 [Monocercomonoides exilis]